jgi:cell division protein FtsX
MTKRERNIWKTFWLVLTVTVTVVLAAGCKTVPGKLM